jgi:rSAM/selenodomain-associated transferase 2
MTISVVIPTLNEDGNIVSLIRHLQIHAGTALLEVIVVDGGSHDQTVRLARKAGATVTDSNTRGRAAQMNCGALLAKGDILYFVHADTLPPPSFTVDIQRAISEGYDLGRYRTKFLSGKKLLRLNAWFTRFDLFIGMGGDQTLFIRKGLFEELGGFNEELVLMEDYEFCARARKKGRYTILDGAALVSARKYEKNSWLQVQLAHAKIVSLYKKGASQQQMVEEYKRMLNW